MDWNPKFQDVLGEMLAVKGTGKFFLTLKQRNRLTMRLDKTNKLVLIKYNLNLLTDTDENGNIDEHQPLMCSDNDDTYRNY